MANCANITRRSIFKLAPAAVLAAGGAIMTFPSLSSANALSQPKDRLEDMLHLWRQLTLEQKTDVMEFLRKANAASKSKVKWSGAGYYEVYVRFDDTEPSLLWIEECWDHMRDCIGYRGYGREVGQRTSAYIYFPKHLLRIHKKV